MTTPTTSPATNEPRGFVSQAALFATEFAKNAAQNMLDTIASISRNSGRITMVALGVSMPHQIGYILALSTPYFKWNSPSAIAESITLILLAFGVPIATDLFILNCIKTVGATAAAQSSKIYALSAMLAPVGVSGYVNFMAPGPVLIKYLAAWCVTLIPLTEAGRAFLRADFVKIEKMETDVIEQLTHTVSKATARTEGAGDSEEAVDMRQLNKQRLLAAEKARELAMQAPEISIAALMRATKCGRGAAKKAIERARAASAESVEVAV